MIIKILGNGGALNEGLSYNSYTIDKKILIETPPDVMVSLRREKIDIYSLEVIYISHLHGDHTFGFPFLALDLFRNEMLTKQNQRIKLFAPDKGKDYLIELAQRALSVNNPCIDWIRERIEFIDTSKESEIKLRDYNAKLFRMEHFQENYGFVLRDDNHILFTYISDTKWSDKVELILKENSKTVMLDLNGEPDEPNPVHLNEKDVIEKCMKIAGPNTVFYGTHLQYWRKSKIRRIKYVKPGMQISIK